MRSGSVIVVAHGGVKASAEREAPAASGGLSGTDGDGATAAAMVKPWAK